MTATQDTTNAWLRAALGLSEPATPFPWQTRLLAELVDGAIPSALDLPTGLGKTSVIAIWAVARAAAAATAMLATGSNAAQAREIPTFTIRRQWRIKRIELDQWIAARPRGGDGGRYGR
jgi:hypothetical protein